MFKSCPLSYLRDPNFCAFGSLQGFILGTYDGADIGWPEGSTEISTGGNLEGLLLGDWIISLYGIMIGTNVGNEIGLSDGKVIGRRLKDLVGIWLYD